MNIWRKLRSQKGNIIGALNEGSQQENGEWNLQIKSSFLFQGSFLLLCRTLKDNKLCHVFFINYVFFFNLHLPSLLCTTDMDIGYILIPLAPSKYRNIHLFAVLWAQTHRILQTHVVYTAAFEVLQSIMSTLHVTIFVWFHYSWSWTQSHSALNSGVHECLVNWVKLQLCLWWNNHSWHRNRFVAWCNIKAAAVRIPQHHILWGISGQNIIFFL